MCLPLVVSALLGVSASRAARRLPPATAVRLLGVAAIVTALGSGFVLAVAGVLVLAQIPPIAALGPGSGRAVAGGLGRAQSPPIAALGHWSGAVVGSRLPVPLVAGWLAAATFCGLLLAASRRTARAGRDLVLAAVACRRLGPSA